MCRFIIIRENKIDFLESAHNLGFIFNDQLRQSNHINVIVEKVYDILKNIQAINDSRSFVIGLQLNKTFLIPVLLQGYEIFVNCDELAEIQLVLRHSQI